MGVIQVVTVRRDESRPWELTTSHMVHTVMLHGVVHNIVPFIVAVSLTWPAHNVGGNLGYI